MRPWLNLIFVAIAAVGGYMAAANNIKPESATFSDLIQNATLVELSHRLEVGMPTGPSGDNPPTITTFSAHDDGTAGIHRYSFPGQWGTHVDPPVHFVQGLRTMEDIPLSEMILPLIVFDVHGKVEEDPDYQVTMDDVRVWENLHGPVPENSFVALRTDWSKRWPATDRMRNRGFDQVSHSPGWSREVIDYLVLERNITAIGHETLDTDPGVRSGAGEWPLQRYYMGLNKYQIENMKNLDQVPPIGATIIATWPLVEDGSGFPARVFALVPNETE